MFDFGFWEMFFILLIGLLVVGPDRLPALATRVGNFVGRVKLKARRLSAQVQQELEAEHLKSLVDEQDQEIDSLRQEAKEVRREIDHAARSARHGGLAGPSSHPSDMTESPPDASADNQAPEGEADSQEPDRQS
ncbi:MAG: Sec-independent protein translocase protein TatB [Halofilum sp. (in: g-proteobacteria)]|nr:Sec-independent protein translocase protein TatB [Halofilum sp. (in: g-proteobacteria)]